MFVLVNIMIKNVCQIFTYVTAVLYKMIKFVNKNTIFVYVNLKKIKNVIQNTMFVNVKIMLNVFLKIINVFVT
jgi:hypothetical protein